ncbi:hypothetical protein B566_EDAN016285 [Ephemera danica]|nr:hypothetical protein B566_EDAN016285 [Ephemera danica]
MQLCAKTQTEVTATHEKATQVSSCNISTKFITVLDTDRKLNCLTGITNLQLLSTIVTIFETIKPCTNKSKITTAENIVITFLKLKLNLPFSVLAFLFNIVPTSVKRNHTIKIMVGISPGGLIVFISRAYEGRASDKHIFSDSGILQLMEPHVDSFMNKQKGTGLLLHVECMLIEQYSRMNDFRILKDTLPWHLSGYAEVITRVVAAAVNLSPALLSDEKFPSISD